MALSPVESGRALVLIEEAIDRLDILRSLGKSLPSQQPTHRQQVPIAALLAQQKTLQERYVALSLDRYGDKHGADEAVDVMRNLKQCRASIAMSLGADDPEILRKLGEISAERASVIDQLKQLSFELSEPGHSFTSLREKVERYLTQDRQLKETLEREKLAEQLRVRLQGELDQIENQFAERNLDVDAAIAKLTNDLKVATEDLAVNVKLEGDITRANINTVQRLRNADIDTIKNEIANVNADIEREGKVAAQTKDFLEKLIEKNRTKLCSWETRLADELGDKTDELATLTAASAETCDQLAALEDRSRIEDALNERQRLDAELAAVEATKLAAMDRLHSAAAAIQGAWRMAKLRKAEKLAAQKKKKKSAKKGKGKKK